MSGDENTEAVARTIAREARDTPGALLPVLHAVQNRLGCIPGESVAPIADELNLSRAEVHGVISFYHDFRQKPPARRVLQICRSEACQALGARALEQALEQHLSTKIGAGTGSGEMSLEAVYCLGNCACGPTVRIDGRIHGRVSTASVVALLAQEDPDDDKNR